MQQERRTIATKDIWQKGLDTLRATRRQTLIIALAGIVGPQLVLGLYLDWQSVGIAELVRTVSDASAAPGVNFVTLIAPAVGFLTKFAAMMILLALMVMSSYFALAHLAVEHHRGGDVPHAGAALRHGLKAALLRGIWLAVAVMILIFLGQFLVAPALLVAILSLNLPIILVAEGRGGMRALIDTLTLRYVRGTEFSPWSVLFALLTLAAFLYTALVLTALLIEQILRADQTLGISSAAWTMTLPGLPFGPIYIVTSLLETFVLGVAVCIMPALTAALYFSVVGKREIGSA